MSQKLNQGPDASEIPADDEYDPADDMLFLIRVGDIRSYVERSIRKAAGMQEIGELPHFAAMTIDQVRALVNVLKGEEEQPDEEMFREAGGTSDFEMGLYNLEQALEHHDNRTASSSPAKA